MKRLLGVVWLMFSLAVPVPARFNWVIPHRHIVISDQSIKYRAYDENRKATVWLQLKIDRENDIIQKFNFSVGGKKYAFPKCVTQLLLSARMSSITITSWYFRKTDYQIKFEASPEDEDGPDTIRKYVAIDVEDGIYIRHTVYLTKKDCTTTSETKMCEP